MGGCVGIFKMASTEPRMTILDALDGPQLLGAVFRDCLTWAAWRAPPARTTLGCAHLGWLSTCSRRVRWSRWSSASTGVQTPSR